jgi:hypothetical protein
VTVIVERGGGGRDSALRAARGLGLDVFLSLTLGTRGVTWIVASQPSAAKAAPLEKPSPSA